MKNRIPDHFSLESLINVLQFTNGSVDDPGCAILIYEYDDDHEDDYYAIDWERDYHSICAIGTGSMLARTYLKPEIAFAKVIKIWALPCEPIRIMIDKYDRVDGDDDAEPVQ